MRILLTGASGMVGRNLIEKEEIKRFEVLTPSRKELNLFYFEDVKKYLNKNKPDLIVHAAGRVGGIQTNKDKPLTFLVENLDIGRNIVIAAYEVGIKKMINIGSSNIYPENMQNPLKEEYLLQGPLDKATEGYAIAKITTLKLCEYINLQNNGFSYKTLIPCNLYGKWDKFDAITSHMIPAVIRRIHQAKRENKEEVVIWGDGNARREYLYVEDFIDALFLAIKEFDRIPTMLNIGLGFDYSMNDYYQAIAEIINYNGSFAYDLTKPVGVKRKLLDINRQIEWGWTAKTSLHDGVRKTYEYFLTSGGDIT